MATGARRQARPITAGCFIAHGNSPPIAGENALCSTAGASYKPRTPHGAVFYTLCGDAYVNYALYGDAYVNYAAYGDA